MITMLRHTDFLISLLMSNLCKRRICMLSFMAKARLGTYNAETSRHYSHSRCSNAAGCTSFPPSSVHLTLPLLRERPFEDTFENTQWRKVELTWQQCCRLHSVSSSSSSPPPPQSHLTWLTSCLPTPRTGSFPPTILPALPLPQPTY